MEKRSRAYFYAETGFYHFFFFSQISFFPSLNPYFPSTFTHPIGASCPAPVSALRAGPIWLRLRMNSRSLCREKSGRVASGAGKEPAGPTRLIGEPVRCDGSREKFRGAAEPADPSVVGCAPACVAVRRRVGEAALWSAYAFRNLTPDCSARLAVTAGTM